MEHSVLGASGAKRWMSCPGCINMCKDIPSSTSVYAEEGTAAHNVAEHCLLLRQRATELEEGVDAFKADFPGKKYITPEMLKHVDVYLDAIYEDLKEGMEMAVEKKFNLDWLHPGMFGTNDCGLAEAFGTLYIYDLKFGKGVGVEVYNNPQLMYYGLGAAYGKDFEYVEMVIVQPRYSHPEGPVRRFKMRTEELIKWGKEVLLPAAKATQKPDAPLKAGPWCSDAFCPVLTSKKVTCPELTKQALEVAKQDFSAVSEGTEIVFPAAETLTPLELSRVMNFQKMMSTWIKDVYATALGSAESGITIPNHKLIRKTKNRSWIDEQRVEQNFAYLKDDLYGPRKLKSPAQMEKVLKDKGVDKNALEGYHEKKEGDISLVHESAKGKEIPPPVEADFNPVADMDFLN